jgi:NAD(P)-dependent dehydrogenase (short-subunit alcohol dehydrogenase family)
MRITGAKVLVTGGNRGLGAALVAAFVASGAELVYAGVRNPQAVRVVYDEARVRLVALDVTDGGSVSRAANSCGDIDLLVNNAAIVANARLVATPDLAPARLEMETNFWGMLRMIRAFAPVLAANGGGAIVNILSIGALGNVPFAGSYCASKAAAHSLTQASRAELQRQGTRVAGVFAGPIATDMAREQDRAGRCPPSVMASNILSGIERDEEAIFPDPVSREIADAYARDPWSIGTRLGAKLD